MLKIKDNINLKELEKFGFRECRDGYVKPMWRDRDVGMFVFGDTDRTICFLGYYEKLKLDDYQETLFDLIQAGLVEKIEDKSWLWEGQCK